MNYNAKRITCPICGGSNIHKIFNQNFSPMPESSIIDTYDVSVCSNCFMAFANNIPSQSEMDEYYFSHNKYEQDLPISMPNAPWYGQISEYIIANFCIDTEIVDIGCGTGNILIELADKGYNNLIGLDTSADNCQRLKKFGITSINKSIFDIEDNSISAELVICISVLEHIVDLRYFVNKIVSLLKPDGKLIITVPEIKINNAKYFPFQEFSTEHINYFTYNSLCSIFAKYDLYPVDRISADDTMTIIFAFNQNDIQYVLEKYIYESSKTIDKCVNSIEPLIMNQTPVTVWGVGTLTRHLLANTDFSKLNIVAFVDSNKNYHGSQLFEKKIISPANIDNNSTIIICAYNAGNSIRETIRKLNLKNDVINLLNNIKDEP